MILFSAYVGLRKGEMLALLGSDIDFREGVVTIERSYTSKTGQIDTPHDAPQRPRRNPDAAHRETA